MTGTGEKIRGHLVSRKRLAMNRSEHLVLIASPCTDTSFVQPRANYCLILTLHAIEPPVKFASDSL